MALKVFTVPKYGFLQFQNKISIFQSTAIKKKALQCQFRWPIQRVPPELWILQHCVYLLTHLSCAAEDLQKVLEGNQ